MTNSDAYPSRHWGDDKHTGVRVVIADTGSGIVAENRSKVFRQVFTAGRPFLCCFLLWFLQMLKLRLRASETPAGIP